MKIIKAVVWFLIGAAIACGFIAHNAMWLITDKDVLNKVFGVFIAMEPLILYVSIRVLFHKLSWKGFYSFIELCIGFTLNSLVDELIFNPYVLELNEYIGAFLVVLTVLMIRSKRNAHTRTKD